MADLSSKSYAKVVDLISEGEIQGLKDGSKSIYLNNTPLQNTDDTYNFQGVTVESRTGANDQSFIALANTDNTEISNVVNVGVTVQQTTPVVRAVSDSTINAVRVTINFPQLRQFNSNGSTGGRSVDLKIAVQYNGGAYTDVITDKVSGRAAENYQKNYLINLSGAFPVNIRVTRVTADNTNPKVVDAFSWASYTEITYAKTRYPNTALVALRFDAEQFGSFPDRAYLIRGVKVRIPSNATVDLITHPGRITYAGAWDGTFKATREWTNDPCWCLFELLTNSRFGFGDHIDATQLDKFSFYAASQYCNELVSDGFGGQEPRFSCNINIQQNEDAYRLINDMASVFRAMPYWSVGSLTVSPDKPANSSYLFNLSNVSEEGFAYSGSSQKTRATVAVVKYFDTDLRDYSYEQVEDQAAIAKYGVQIKQIEAFACTSRGQAHRLGKWLLYTEQYETEIIAFTTSIAEGVIVRPGMVIDVADPLRTGQRRGGRISAATTTAITVDDATGLTTANSATLSVVLPNGTVETRSISTIVGKVITVSSAFTAAPVANSVWIHQSTALQTSQWRVVSVAETDDCQYGITALSYNASKYNAIEQNLALQARNISTLNQLPDPPTNIAISEALYTYQDQIKAQLSVTWQPVTDIGQYQVRWRKDDSNWTTADSYGPTYELLDITPGFFEFEVYSVKSTGLRSTLALTGSITALGKTAPPSNVTGFTATNDLNLGVILSWTGITDIDLGTYEIRRGASWDAGTLVTQVNATSYKIGALSDGNYTYWIKAIDTSKVYSATAASVTVNISAPNAPTVSSTIQSTDAVLNWSEPAITAYAIDYYLVKLGASYATASEVARTKSTTLTIPITWTGSRTYWVAAVDISGRVTVSPNSTIVTVSLPSAPSVSRVVAGSDITLSWTAVTGTLPTAEYEIRKGASFNTATVLTKLTGLTYTFRADFIGTDTVWVTAIDVNGNYGTSASTTVSVNTAAAPAASVSFSGQNAVLTWNATKGSLDTEFYRLKRGTTWGTATLVADIKGTAYTLKVDWGGTQRFLLAAVDITGSEGAAGSIDIAITSPTAPSISQQVIDNNVLLRWNDVTQTLPILNYELRKGATWAAATVIGKKQGGFTSVFETSAGTYTYWLAGIDSAGNYGTPGSVTAIVNQPPDYVLQLDQASTWAGTETNIYTDAQLGQIVNVNTTETWQSHFTSRGWTSPQSQINAGYSYFLMPTTTTASYVEEIDVGTVLAGTKISLALTSQNISGATTVTPTIEVRQTTGSSWTTYAGVSEVYATQFRYVRVRYDFASAGGDDLLVLSALNIRLDAKIRNDAGSGTANSADTGGTVVNFNYPFIDVQSISVTPLSTSAIIAVYDFVDVPNPTSFKVLLFNATGNRVSGPFSWSARGV